MRLRTISSAGAIGLLFCLLLSCSESSFQGNADSIPAPLPASIQAPINEAAFLESFVAAINAKDTEKLRQLVHLASLACITDENRDFYDAYFSRVFKGGNMPEDCARARIQRLAPDEALPISGGSECKVRIKPVSASSPLPFENDFSYPLRPTHLVQIEYGDRSKMIQVIQDNALWSEVVPCPKPETVRKFREREMKQ